MKSVQDERTDNDDYKENEKYLSAVDILISRALSDKDPLTRKHSLYLLGMTGDPRCADILIQALSDPEKAIRNLATRALTHIGPPVLPKVIDLLTDKDWKVRYRAAEIIGEIGSREGVMPLIKALSDEKDHVRYMAAKSLGKIGDPTTLDALKKCQDDENPYVRNMAKRAISAMEE